MKEVKDLTNEQFLNFIEYGDSASFNEIYYKYRRKVYGYAYRFTRSAEKSEELTQDVFVRVWENRSKIDISKSFEGYLFILSRNSFLKTLRSSLKEVLFCTENSKIEPSCNAIDDYLDFKDCQQVAHSAIEAMTPQAKIAFLLSRDKGCSHEEISQRMGISKNTVNRHISSSLKTIRRFIKAYSPETVLSLLLVAFA